MVIIEQALRKEPLTVYGDGKQTRSFQFVSDLVSPLLFPPAKNVSIIVLQIARTNIFYYMSFLLVQLKIYSYLRVGKEIQKQIVYIQGFEVSNLLSYFFYLVGSTIWRRKSIPRVGEKKIREVNLCQVK